ncbi:MAG: hypothetical protein K6V73_12735 [Firmicutes bacterium]|nr:hypothetical protein [Bacillota bacterium]
MAAPAAPTPGVLTPAPPSAAPWGRRMGGLLSLLVYAAVVSHPATRWVVASDRLGCVDPHALVDTAVLLAGVVLGLAWGADAVRAAYAGADALLSEASPPRRRAYVRTLAVLTVVLGMAVNVLWILPSLNLFVDRHAALAVEVDVLVYLMGALAGAAWHAILDRQAWVGALVTAAMSLMVVGGVLSQHAWC